MYDVDWCDLKREPHPRTKAQKAGIDFENEVALFTKLNLPDGWECAHGPWIEYTVGGYIRHAQPDLLLTHLTAHVALVIECKLRHTRTALAQMKKYTKLTKALFPRYRVAAIEVFKFHDHIEFPNRLEQEWPVKKLPPMNHCHWTGELPRLIL